MPTTKNESTTDDVSDVEGGDEVAPAPIEMVTIEWRGGEFVIPKDMDDWDFDACIAVTEASQTRALKDLRLALRLSLGELQFSALLARGKTKRDIEGFALVFGKAVDEECI